MYICHTFFLKVLANVGKYDILYNHLTSKADHSWINMLNEGATTCFEAWGKEVKIEHKPMPPQ